MEKELTYFESVSKLAKMHSDSDIPNSSIKHARDILITMVENSEKNINIFSGELRTEVYNDIDFIVSVVAFLKFNDDGKKGEMNVVVQNLTSDGIKETLFYRMLKYFKVLESCKFYVVDDGSEAKNYKEHFQTADGKAYRNEYDKAKIKAIANFNNPKKTKELDEQFTRCMKQSSPVPA